MHFHKSIARRQRCFLESPGLSRPVQADESFVTRKCCLPVLDSFNLFFLLLRGLTGNLVCTFSALLGEFLKFPGSFNDHPSAAEQYGGDNNNQHGLRILLLAVCLYFPRTSAGATSWLVISSQHIGSTCATHEAIYESLSLLRFVNRVFCFNSQIVVLGERRRWKVKCLLRRAYFGSLG